MWVEVTTGGTCIVGSEDPRTINSPTEWGQNRTVRGAFVAGLLSQVGASRPLAPPEVHIRGVRVIGTVDLSHAEIPAVLFGQSLFEDDLILLSSGTRNLHFDNCVLNSLNATGAEINGFLLVTQSRIRKGVSLIDARVRKSVGFSGSEIVGCDGRALHADGLEAGGGFILSRFPNKHGSPRAYDDFRAIGEVRLLSARISRDLDCSGGRFENAGGVALAVDRGEVRGEVRFASGFHATGEVRLWRTRIGSDLTCLDGSFENPMDCRPRDDSGDPRGQDSAEHSGEPGDYALRADGAEIKGSVNLSNGFRSKGVVYFVGARIDGDLNCSGGTFDNVGGDALAADSAMIGGSIRLDSGFLSNGLVGLLGAKISGQLNCSGGRFNNPKSRSLGADGAHIQGNVNLADGFHATGEVRFLTAQIDGQMNCTGGRFQNQMGTALTIQECTLNSLWLRDLDLGSRGDIVLAGSRVNLLSDDPELSSREDVNLLLNGFLYEHFAPDAPQDVKSRLRWLRRQSPGYHPQTFEQLAAAFRRSGQFQEAREVDIANLRERRKTLSGWWSRYWDWLLDFAFRYGWQPWRPLRASLLVFVVSFGLVSIAQTVGLLIGPLNEASQYHPIIHVLDVFLSAVDFGVESRWTIDTVSGGAFASGCSVSVDPKASWLG